MPLLHAQDRVVGEQVRPFVKLDASIVALTHVRLIDGTGSPARENQTVVVVGERIAAVGPTGTVAIPPGAKVLDRSGHSLIPGIIGLHDHLYYQQPMFFSYPKLFLAAGVTTIRTTGSRDAYQELNHRSAIEAGEIPGPDIHVTGPYLQGPGPGPGWMHPLTGPEDARRVVRYWAEEGVNWFKAYTQISRAELAAAVDEAHRHGVKVTGHLCSVGFREAVAAGIDNLEHGFTTNADFLPGKMPDVCPPGRSDSIYARLDVQSESVQETIRLLVANGVALTSTLAVEELGSPSRVPADQRVLDALYDGARSMVERYFENAKDVDDSLARQALRNAMAFEREFVRAGGLLAAGSDPCCLSSIASYADQRNYELLVEAGFSPEQSIQIMTANGANVLGISDRVGTIEKGMQADLVVLRGDITSDPRSITNVTDVFRRGLGYDPEKLTAAVRGLVGLR